VDWITEHVAIGNHREALDAALLKAHAFRAVLSLDGSLSASRATELGLIEIAAYRLIDGAGNDPRFFRLAVADLSRLASSMPPVLVQCHAGRSRSVAVVAAYLMGLRRIELAEAVAAIAAKREVSVAAELFALLFGLER
jgi:protein-tyrosine phosphatase